jgi:hypothetical protein
MLHYKLKTGNMKHYFAVLLLLVLAPIIKGQDLPLIKISTNNQYLVTENEQPFFWLGGTAWELLHRLTKEEIDLYLSDRAKKGFTIIQTVILAELDGLNTPNAYGEKPLNNNNPGDLNEKYFELVDYVITRAAQLGLYVGLLPSWGDKFNKKWGIGPEIFTPENAEKYGEILANRYLSHNNIIWILGGDREPENENHYAIIRGMAKGIREIDTRHLITYHPVGGKKATDFFRHDTWLDIDMFQSGHSRLTNDYEFVLESKKLEVKRPVINGEARYENIRDRFWENKDYGWLDDADVRISAYWTMLSGAAGYTYGCNDIWQMYEVNREPNIEARTDWQVALNLPGSSQMKYMKEIFEIFPWQSMQLNQLLILNNNPRDESYIVSAIGENKDFVLAYTPTGNPIKIDLTQMRAEKVKAYWYNPRSGRILFTGDFETNSSHEFIPWSNGWGSDFLLIIVEKDSSYDFSKFNN